ncbi:unnamed protein product [Cunninghamella blakesleeana]
MLSRQFFSTLKKPIPLTRVKHPEIRRGAYKKLTNEDVSYFKSILPSQQIKLNDDVDIHNVDFFKLFRGDSKLCLFPTSTEQVSSILKYCNQEKIAVVPQGGNTGVSGGAIPLFDEVIINTSKLNKIREFDDVSGIAVVDSGVILENLDQYLKQNYGYTVPLDLGAKGSCQIGGNVSTNAGGLRLMRFGNLHGNVLGLEVVLPDGTILDSLDKLRKNNTGYDLKQLFIGAEGTLGLVTAVSLLTPKKALSTNVALMSVDSFDQLQKAFVSAKSHLGEILSAFEFWDKESIGVVQKTLIQGPFPIGQESKFYALVETQGSRQDHDMEKLENYLEELMSKKIIQDGVLAQDEKQMTNLWQWREKIPEALPQLGTAMTYDFSMSISLLYKMVEDARSHFGKQGLVGKQYTNIIGFGHMGDGNLHIMANIHGFDDQSQEMFDEFVFNWAIEHQGSISAEHGIGIHKIQYMPKYKNQNQLKLMHSIKQMIDPNSIMNPYKVLPQLQ